MDRLLYDLLNARSFLRNALLQLDYAAVFLDGEETWAIYEDLKAARSIVQHVLERVEARLGEYRFKLYEYDAEVSTKVREILLAVIRGD